MIAAVLLSAVLSACGGGGGGSGPVGAPGATGATGASVPIGGNAGNGAGGSGDLPVAGAPGSGGGGLVAVPAAAKGATTLSWMPPTTYDDGTPLKVTGYRIYWGLSEDHYPHSVTLDNPGLTRYVIEQLDPATWYFVATALSADGESSPSNVVAMEVL